MAKKIKTELTLTIAIFFLLPIIVYAAGVEPPGEPDDHGTGGTTPPPYNPDNPPIDYCAQKGVHCIDKVNERPSGEFVLLDSVSSMYSDKFHFPGVKDITFNAYGGFLTSATVSSSADDSVLWINNPLESAEKINIYLKNSHTLSYSFSNNEMSIAIPAGSWINITKDEKSLVIQSTGGDIRISVIRESLGEYRALKYAVQNGNLIYSNGKIVEKLLSQTIFAFFDMDKGFGYIKLNPKDSFEYYDLEKKENSYSLYNNGNNIFEFGIEDAGLTADILPQISPVNFGYFHTKGQRQILLNGIVAYKRIQSYTQLKITKTFEDYQKYLEADIPFLPVYTARKTSQAFLDLRSENFTSKVSAEINPNPQGNEIAWLQNRNHHTFWIESDGQYYYKYNAQDCPAYSLYHNGEANKPRILFEGQSLRSGNFKVNVKGTNEFDKIKPWIPAKIMPE